MQELTGNARTAAAIAGGPVSVTLRLKWPFPASARFAVQISFH
jgi:hypothetical protein